MRLAAIAILLALLFGTAAVAVHALEGLEGVSLGFHGTLALVLGIVFTLLLGGGLMFLLFHSARSGHDEIAGNFTRQEGKENE
ncbi:MAG: hypothetical protein ACE5ED_06035 [Rhodothalassiaceae bacterium]